jgi:hypothetical protein
VHTCQQIMTRHNVYQLSCSPIRPTGCCCCGYSCCGCLDCSTRTTTQRPRSPEVYQPPQQGQQQQRSVVSSNSSRRRAAMTTSLWKSQLYDSRTLFLCRRMKVRSAGLVHLLLLVLLSLQHVFVRTVVQCRLHSTTFYRSTSRIPIGALTWRHQLQRQQQQQQQQAQQRSWLYLLRGGNLVEAEEDVEEEDEEKEEDDLPLPPATSEESSSSSSTTTVEPSGTSSSNDNDYISDKTYAIQQQLFLQTRSVQLRQALVQRGLYELSHIGTTTATASAPTTTRQHGTTTSSSTSKQIVDWECALSTKEYPKSCLYSLDAEYGQKVIAPMLPEDEEDEVDADADADAHGIDSETEQDSTTTVLQKKKKKKRQQQHEWITISSLNRLYRTDPNKVESLWYDRYTILNTWFSRNNHRQPHPYNLYTHVQTLYGTLITTTLNVQPFYIVSLSLLVIGTIVTCIMTLPFLESTMTVLVTSSLLWNSWSTWSRFTTHAALPLQLLIVQILWSFTQQFLNGITQQLRTILVEEECRLLQECIPLTIIEGLEE